MNNKPVNSAQIAKCPNMQCQNVIEGDHSTCQSCGLVIMEQRIEDDPFHFAYTQLEKHFDDKDNQLNQIKTCRQAIGSIFSWLTNEDLEGMTEKCVQMIQKKQLPRQQNFIKYLFTALVFDLIRKRKDLNQQENIKRLLSECQIKGKILLSYLQMIDSERVETEEIFLDQLTIYEKKLREFFVKQGGQLLFLAKQSFEEKTKQKTNYTQTIESILQSVRKTIEKLYQLENVKQFSEGKRPSRLIISLGYTALQIQSIYILLQDYAKIFDISQSTLKYFTTGLKDILVQDINKYQGKQQLANEKQKEEISEDSQFDSYSFNPNNQSYSPKPTNKKLKLENSYSTFPGLELEPINLKKSLDQDCQQTKIDQYKLINTFLETQFDRYFMLQQKARGSLKQVT